MKTTIKIADRLIELMTLKGINNSTLAAEIGVSNVTVGRWVNGNNSFKLSNCLKLVNYFNCSLDFLTGRSDITIDFVPKNCPPLYNHIRQLMQKKGISRNEINHKTTIKSSHFVDWNKGRDPHIVSLIELADYLDVTLDELVGRDS